MRCKARSESCCRKTASAESSRKTDSVACSAVPGSKGQGAWKRTGQRSGRGTRKPRLFLKPYQDFQTSRWTRHHSTWASSRAQRVREMRVRSSPGAALTELPALPQVSSISVEDPNRHFTVGSLKPFKGFTGLSLL